MSNVVLRRATKNSAVSPSRPNSGCTNASAHRPPRCSALRRKPMVRLGVTGTRMAGNYRRTAGRGTDKVLVGSWSRDRRLPDRRTTPSRGLPAVWSCSNTEVDPRTVAMELADLLVGLAVTIIGLYLTHSLRRQQRLKVAEQRMASYGELWKLMEIARPTRLEAWEAAGPLTRKEARGLYADMTHWYFGTAHGMLLTETTKKLYLRTKASLGQYVVGTDP